MPRIDMRAEGGRARVETQGVHLGYIGIGRRGQRESVERTEPGGKVSLAFIGQVLVSEKEHEMIDEALLDLGDLIVRQGLLQVDPAHLGANDAPDRAYIH
jgi:hypothetical protein